MGEAGKSAVRVSGVCRYEISLFVFVRTSHSFSMSPYKIRSLLVASQGCEGDLKSFLDDVAARERSPPGDAHDQLSAHWNKMRESFASVAPLIQELLDGRGLPKDHTVGERGSNVNVRPFVRSFAGRRGRPTLARYPPWIIARAHRSPSDAAPRTHTRLTKFA